MPQHTAPHPPAYLVVIAGTSLAALREALVHLPPDCRLHRAHQTLGIETCLVISHPDPDRDLTSPLNRWLNATTPATPRDGQLLWWSQQPSPPDQHGRVRSDQP